MNKSPGIVRGRSFLTSSAPSWEALSSSLCSKIIISIENFCGFSWFLKENSEIINKIRPQ